MTGVQTCALPICHLYIGPCLVCLECFGWCREVSGLVVYCSAYQIDLENVFPRSCSDTIDIEFSVPYFSVSYSGFEPNSESVNWCWLEFQWTIFMAKRSLLLNACSHVATSRPSQGSFLPVSFMTTRAMRCPDPNTRS